MSKRAQRKRELQRRCARARARQRDGGPRPADREVIPPQCAETLLWHYTTGQGFIGVIDAGVIRPATARVAADERPIVWFSSNQEWEPTSTKIYVAHDGQARRLSKEELRVKATGWRGSV